jgi:hypothetical protein
MSRSSLSTFTDGSYISLDASVSTLIHRETAATNTSFIKISGFNRGKRTRNITFLFDDTEALYASVQPTGSSQILVPDVPIYNTGTGIDIYATLRHSTSSWQLPDDLKDIITISNGKLLGVILTGVSATANAQPILLHVKDSRRSNTDIDINKGSEAIIELFQVNGSVAVEIIYPGYNLVHDNIDVHIHSGVYLFGNVFSD